jgi:hypothetical protein
MAYFAALNGGRVISAHVEIPYYGAWTADVVLAADTVLATEDVLTIGDLSLQGFVQRVFDFGGSRSTRMVGGFGGWQKVLPAKAYSLPSGVPLSMILGDAATECGEQWGGANPTDLAAFASASVGQAFVREKAPAQRVLRLLTPGLWWIDGTGATRLAPRATGIITSQFTAVRYSGGKGQFEIATETLGDWQPGRTFKSPTITSVQTISMTSVIVDNSGKLRLSVLTTP